MMRPTTWQWRGDFFDPEMPLAIELHFQFWNPRLERLSAEGVDEFWTRRVRRPVGGADLAVLSPADAVGYSALSLAFMSHASMKSPGRSLGAFSWFVTTGPWDRS